MGVLADEERLKTISHDGKNSFKDENFPGKSAPKCKNAMENKQSIFSGVHYDTTFTKASVEMRDCGDEAAALSFPASSVATCSSYEIREVESDASISKDLDQSNYIRSRGSRKEKKRTECINTAFSELRRRIPNVPMDTKLSKIKTLRLATSYISYLTDIVRNSDPTDIRDGTDFRADLKALRTRERRRDIHQKQMYAISQNKNFGNTGNNEMNTSENVVDSTAMRKKGRTGWPEAVWAMELETISSRPADQMGPPFNPGLTVPKLQQHQIHNASANTSLHQAVYVADNSMNGGNHHFTENGRNVPCSFENPLLSCNYKLEQAMVPTARESTVCSVDPYPSYGELIPHFPYTPIPLPAASSFSKRLSQAPPERFGVQELTDNCQTAHIQQNIIQTESNSMDMSRTQMEYMGQTPHKFLEPMPVAGHVTTNMHAPSMLHDITFFPNPPNEQIIWESSGTEDCKEANFAELKTVSPASIRISTSTMNGFATFTTSGRSELQCFGAARVMEPNNT